MKKTSVFIIRISFLLTRVQIRDITEISSDSDEPNSTRKKRNQAFWNAFIIAICLTVICFGEITINLRHKTQLLDRIRDKTQLLFVYGEITINLRDKTQLINTSQSGVAFRHLCHFLVLLSWHAFKAWTSLQQNRKQQKIVNTMPKNSQLLAQIN